MTNYEIILKLQDILELVDNDLVANSYINNLIDDLEEASIDYLDSAVDYVLSNTIPHSTLADHIAIKEAIQKALVELGVSSSRLC